MPSLCSWPVIIHLAPSLIVICPNSYMDLEGQPSNLTLNYSPSPFLNLATITAGPIVWRVHNHEVRTISRFNTISAPIPPRTHTKPKPPPPPLLPTQLQPQMAPSTPAQQPPRRPRIPRSALLIHRAYAAADVATNCCPFHGVRLMTKAHWLVRQLPLETYRRWKRRPAGLSATERAELVLFARLWTFLQVDVGEAVEEEGALRDVYEGVMAEMDRSV